MDIHIEVSYRVIYKCSNELFAVSSYKDLYLDLHGLIFETSIWLLAGSTRLECSKLEDSYNDMLVALTIYAECSQQKLLRRKTHV